MSSKLCLIYTRIKHHFPFLQLDAIAMVSQTCTNSVAYLQISHTIQLQISIHLTTWFIYIPISLLVQPIPIFATKYLAYIDHENHQNFKKIRKETRKIQGESIHLPLYFQPYSRLYIILSSQCYLCLFTFLVLPLYLLHII